MAEKQDVSSRRHWLLRSLNSSIAATVAMVLYPVARFLWPRPATVSGAMEIVAPFRVNQLPGAADTLSTSAASPVLSS